MHTYFLLLQLFGTKIFTSSIILKLYFILILQGERHRRLEGDAYWSAIDELCDAVKEIWPQALLQFEDFETSKAFSILERRRHKQLCFNDDIQGTGAVVTTGIINGLKVQGTDPAEAKILFYGAGSSAVGVAEAISAYLECEGGVPRDQARKAIFMVDSKGLIHTSRGDKLPSHKQLFARNEEDLKNLGIDPGKKEDLEKMKDLKAVIAAVQPHALVGLSAAGPSWPQEVVEELCRHVKQPLIFPLSNPTDKAEITADEALRWSNGAAIFASGSPFDPVEINGKKVIPGQANNVLVFPGVGFGAVMAKSTSVSDKMFTAAAKALAEVVSPEELKMGQLYPGMKTLRETSAVVAAAVAEAAWKEGVSGLEAVPPEGWKQYIERKMWWPDGRTTVVSGMERGVEEREE